MMELNLMRDVDDVDVGENRFLATGTGYRIQDTG